jgi:radical SAM superfamily enzyme YgiQ (UPF0313 family)
MPHLKNPRGANSAPTFSSITPACHNQYRDSSYQNSKMNVFLIATYEQGHQPFGLASPAAWLRAANAKVACLDISRDPLDESAVRNADLIAIHVPMHTATRLAIELIAPIRAINPQAHLCFYGLYSSVNEAYLRKQGVQTILGGEFEAGLASLANRLASNTNNHADSQSEPLISLARQNFQIPDRQDLPPLDRYATLRLPDGTTRTAGYTESSRGCKHLCRHCPIVPVYNGAFRIIPKEIVLEDIRRQVDAGAQHITFGDPDFFNGIGHAIPLIESLHQEFPHLTYDATIKIEHLRKHESQIAKLRDTGCLFITSAVESIDDAVLEKLAKNHTRQDFEHVLQVFRANNLPLQPTFVPFSPWTTPDSYNDLLDFLAANDLIENVAPIQLAIRLLIPAGSRLFDLPDIQNLAGPFDEKALVHPWQHPDPNVDKLCEQIQQIVHTGEKLNRTRHQIFARIQEAARNAAGLAQLTKSDALPLLAARATIPYLTEPWYC